MGKMKKKSQDGLEKLANSDAFDSYYQCITSCYGLEGEDIECITECVEVHFGSEPPKASQKPI